MAEQGTHKPLAGGSNPPSATTFNQSTNLGANFERDTLSPGRARLSGLPTKATPSSTPSSLSGTGLTTCAG